MRYHPLSRAFVDFQVICNQLFTSTLPAKSPPVLTQFCLSTYMDFHSASLRSIENQALGCALIAINDTDFADLTHIISIRYRKISLRYAFLLCHSIHIYGSIALLAR